MFEEIKCHLKRDELSLTSSEEDDIIHHIKNRKKVKLMKTLKKEPAHTNKRYPECGTDGRGYTYKQALRVKQELETEKENNPYVTKIQVYIEEVPEKENEYYVYDRSTYFRNF